MGSKMFCSEGDKARICSRLWKAFRWGFCSQTYSTDKLLLSEEKIFYQQYSLIRGSGYVLCFQNKEILKYLVLSRVVDTTMHCHTLNPLDSKIVILTDVYFLIFNVLMLSYTVRVFYMYLLILGFYKHYFYMCLYAFSIEIMLPTVLSNGRYCLRFVLPKRQYYVLPHIKSKNSYLNICLFSHTQCSYVVLYCIFYCYLLIFGCYTVNTAFSTFVCVYAFFVFNYVMWARNIRLTWSLS